MKKKKRGPGRPQIWKEPLLRLKFGQSLPANNRSQANTIAISGRRLGYKMSTFKQPDQSYVCTKLKPTR